jgi:hypothetical protein
VTQPDSSSARSWVLNPGAERELLGTGATPNRRTLAQMKERGSLFDHLCAGEARLWLEDLRAEGATGKRRGRALLWCPTPSALRICHAAGLRPQPAPPLDVLRLVLSKAFLASALPEWTAPHHRTIRTLDAYRSLRAAVSVPLRAKRLDGYAGKGQRTLYSDPRPGDELWVQQLLGSGGLVVEAELTPTGEFSVHGVISADGTLIGEPCLVHTDDARAPLRVPTPCPTLPFAEEIRARGQDAADALARGGYFGPFGLDLILTDRGLFATDLNARFTLGFSAGLGSLRSRALELVLGAE